MNYDFGFVTSNGTDISNILSQIESISDKLTTTTDNLSSNWSSPSFNNYSNAKGKMTTNFNNESEQLAEIINLLGLIQRHNALRKERAEKQARIEALKPRLYTTHKDKDGHTHRVLNEAVAREIRQLEERIAEINKEMDALVTKISAITGG